MKRIVPILMTLVAVGGIALLGIARQFVQTDSEPPVPIPSRPAQSGEAQRLTSNQPQTSPTFTPLPPPSIQQLQDQFTNSTDKRSKQLAASMLVVALEDDAEYYEYLEEIAALALASEIPYPLSEDGELSSEFEAWCAANDMDPGETTQHVMFELPQDVGHLSKTGDARAYDLLVQGLSSDNLAIVAEAARGLAYINDPAAIALITDAAAALPEGISRSMVAYTLLYFDDPAAQAAAAQLIGDLDMLDAFQQQVDQERVEP